MDTQYLNVAETIWDSGLDFNFNSNFIRAVILDTT